MAVRHVLVAVVICRQCLLGCLGLLHVKFGVRCLMKRISVDWILGTHAKDVSLVGIVLELCDLFIKVP